MRNKNIGKYFLLSIIVLLGVYSNYVTSGNMFKTVEYEPCTVVDKGTSLTHHKHSTSEHFILAVRFDNPEYGMQDINVTFGTWSTLDKGSRTMFKPNSGTLSGSGVTWFLIALVIDSAILVIMCMLLCNLIKYIWDY